jgi:hypothetical protein
MSYRQRIAGNIEDLLKLSKDDLPSIHMARRDWLEIADALKGSARSERKLTKPAQVGHTRFGVGVGEQLVIDRAQREYEYQMDPVREAARIARAKVAIEAFANFTEADLFCQCDPEVQALQYPELGAPRCAVCGGKGR